MSDPTKATALTASLISLSVLWFERDEIRETRNERRERPVKRDEQIFNPLLVSRERETLSNDAVHEIEETFRRPFFVILIIRRGGKKTKKRDEKRDEIEEGKSMRMRMRLMKKSSLTNKKGRIRL